MIVQFFNFLDKTAISYANLVRFHCSADVGAARLTFSFASTV